MEKVQEISKKISELNLKMVSLVQEEKKSKTEIKDQYDSLQKELRGLEQSRIEVIKETVKSDPSLLAAKKALAEIENRHSIVINQERIVEAELKTARASRGREVLYHRSIVDLNVEISRLQTELDSLRDAKGIFETVKKECNDAVVRARVTVERKLYAEL